MKYIKKLFKLILVILSFPVVYTLVALILGSITVNSNQPESEQTASIYLSTNGVHLDIIIPRKNISKDLLKDLRHTTHNQYFAFGWGDENFYLNTPTWADLTFKNAFSAAFLKSTTLMHVSRYNFKRTDWVEVKLSKSQLKILNTQILNSFKVKENSKIILEGSGYTINDNFYKAKGSYSLFKTCNTWVNSILKESNIKASLWTPFDFLLLNKYH